MAELELTRSRDDRRRYDVDGVGALRLVGVFSRAATAEAAGGSWSFDRRSFWQRTIDASDAAGTVVGSFEPRTVRRGGMVCWGNRELELRPASMFKERYALADGERELAIFDGKGWGKRPVRITIDDPAAIEPGLVLFAAYLVRRLAEDASSAAGGASAAAVG
jgi:hypothetical protein